MSLLNSIKNISSRYPIFFLFILHTLFVALIVLFLRVFVHLPADFFLSDDGYYTLGKNFFYGYTSLWHQFRGPGIPIILSPLNFFPDFLHPYLRILVTQLFTFINIYLAFKILSRFLTQNVIFWGLIISLFNPLYLWWACLKLSPEVFVTTFLGLIIFISLQLLEKNKIALWIALFIIMLISMLFKPVFFLIPLSLTIYFLKNKKFKSAIVALFLFSYSLLILTAFMVYTKPLHGHSYGDDQLILDAFFTESLLQTGQLGFYQGGGPVPEKNSNMEYCYTKIDQWRAEYELKNDKSNPIKMNIEFIKEKAGIIFLSKLFNPIYFISMADTTNKTILNFVINSIIIFVSLKYFLKVKKDFPQQLILMLFIFISLYCTYFLTTAIARYFIPILFYFAVFSGMAVIHLIQKLHVKLPFKKI